MCRSIVHAIRVIRIFALLQFLVQITCHVIRHVLVSRIVGIVRLHVQIHKRDLVVLRHRLHHAAGIVIFVAGREHVTATVQVHRRNQDDIGALCLSGVHIFLDISREICGRNIASFLTVITVIMAKLHEQVITLLELALDFVQTAFFNKGSRTAATDGIVIHLHARCVKEITKYLTPTRLRISIILISANS